MARPVSEALAFYGWALIGAALVQALLAVALSGLMSVATSQSILFWSSYRNACTALIGLAFWSSLLGVVLVCVGRYPRGARTTQAPRRDDP